MSAESKSKEMGEECKDVFGKIIDKGAKVFQQGGETIETAIKSALSFRDNVVMVRINQESLKKMDELVDAGLFKSRSESAAFLIREGIKAREDIFNRIDKKINEIQKLKEELKDIVSSEFTANKVEKEKKIKKPTKTKK